MTAKNPEVTQVMMRNSGGSTEPRFIQVSLKREPDNSKFCYVRTSDGCVDSNLGDLKLSLQRGCLKRVESPEAVRAVMKDVRAKC